MVTDVEVPPTGEADNGGSAYTLKMDGNTQGAVDVNMEESSTATFKDYIVNKEAGMYYFAPVVETFTGRSDYNTYGAPVQQSGVATIEAKVSEAIMSKNTFTVDNDPNLYAHYNVTLDLSKLLIPEHQNDALKDYDLYKVRVWRQMETDLLGEEQPDYAYRLGDEIGGGMSSYLFEEITYGDEGIPCYIGTDTENVGILGHVLGKEVVGSFGSHTNNVARGTFGARQVGGEKGVASLPMKFIVRSYFTKKNNLPATAQPAGAKAPMRAGEGDGKFYIVQQEIPYEITSSIITGISDVNAGKQVSGVMYYDMTGKVMPNPQGGVYIEVTRYSDGTTSTRKVVK
jgi:hypothetical protein